MRYPHDDKRRGDAKSKPICVFTMGKVGGMSLVYYLRNHFPNVYCRHEYHPKDSRDNSAPVPDVNGHRDSNKLTKLYLKKVATPENPAKVISLIREPGARLISSFFFSNQLGFFRNLPFGKIENPTAQDYNNAIVNEYDWMWHTSWYDRQMKPLYGVDVFDAPFPKERGWQIVQKDNVKLLLFRTEDFNATASDALSEFFNKPLEAPAKRANATNEKNYLEFRGKMRFPGEMLDKLYGKQARHFYTDEEIDKFRSRLSE